MSARPSEVIRAARVEDVPALVEMVNAVYRSPESKDAWTTEAELVGGDRVRSVDIEKMLSRPDEIVFVAEECGVLTGCVRLVNQGSYAYLGMLSVRVGQQKSGLGSRLIEHCESFAREKWGSQKMIMWVLTVRTELLNWYLRRGYEITPKRLPYSAINDPVGWPLVENLEFAVLEKALLLLL